MWNSYVIAGCMLAGTVLSWIVALVAGDLSAQSYRSMVWPYAVFGVLAAVAGWAHLKADVRAPAGVKWKACVGAAVAIHLAAALSIPFTSGDLWSNVAYGRMAALGIDPYTAGPSALPAGDQLSRLLHPIWSGLPMPHGLVPEPTKGHHVRMVGITRSRRRDEVGSLVLELALPDLRDLVVGLRYSQLPDAIREPLARNSASYSALVPCCRSVAIW